MVAEVKEKLARYKQAAQKFIRERFYFRKLNELEVKEQYQIQILNRSATLDNLRCSEDINRAWENIKEYIKISAKESPILHEMKQQLKVSVF